MRGIRRALALSASLALLPSISFAYDPYTDYRIPEHYWRSWSASLTAGGNHDLGNSLSGSSGTAGRLNGSMGTSYIGGYDSDPRSSAYGLSLALAGTRFHGTTQDDGTLGSSDETRRAQDASERVLGFFAFSRYPWSAPLGFSLGSNQSLGFDQSWTSVDGVTAIPPQEARSSSNFTQGRWSVVVSGSASLVWGRVRDATPVYQVQVLEQRLMDEGTIQKALSPGARERLASLYTTESQLAFAHQRPTKYFWRELERLLQEDGVLSAGGLDAYSVQRLLEPLTITGSPVARAHGFSVGPLVTVLMLQTQTSEAIASSSALYQNGTLVSSSESNFPRNEVFHRNDSVLSGVSVDYHRPFGPHWQADGVSRALLTESGETLFFETGLQATWLVTDRWLASTKFSHDLAAPGSGWDRQASQWHVIWGASLSYFLEDSWAIQASALQQQAHDPINYDRRESFSIGLSHQFAGWLNAPGLFEPMRLSPPAH